ncbi:helicase RepA family protein [Marivita sp.]|uniref:helicase RepA family protein n=1 Tax=Marivita sp. TaxID=2003365 RepID=UPI003B5C7528
MTDDWSLKDYHFGTSFNELDSDQGQARSNADFADFEAGAAMAKQPFGMDEAAPEPKPTNPSGFQFVAVGDLQYRAPEYIVEELFETETLGLIFGDPGCGKSFLAVDLALSVASGTPFHGRAVRRGAVFFIAGEGHNGLARRFAAWSKARDVALADIPLFKSERAAQFLDGASAKAVADAVEALAGHHGQPALIIIDTLARNFGAGDENNTKDMSEFVVAIDDLKARFPGSSVLIVHHSGHAEKQRARGAMALKGALDTEYRIELDGKVMRLVNTKMKDAEPPQDVYFQFEQVDLGDAKSAVLEATEAPERQQKLTPAQKLGRDTYITAAAAQGSWEDGAFRGVHVDAWRDAFYEKHTGDNAGAKKKAFQRVRSDLVAAGQMTVTDDVYFVKDAAIQMLIVRERDKRDIPGQNEKCPGAEAD